uniref:Secreted protein n=1 Tax=Globodera pallida TaxID=36090 RepID=A0A183BU79_GLOPA
MEPNLMAISLACLVRFLSAAEKMANSSFASATKQRIVAHCVTANFAELAAFVLQNSLSADLIRSLWQFIHALSTIEYTISAMPDLVTALSALIGAEPSLLTQQFPLGPTERGLRPLPLLTLCNLLRNSTPNSSASRQLATLLHVGIDDGPKNIEDSHISKTF